MCLSKHHVVHFQYLTISVVDYTAVQAKKFLVKNLNSSISSMKVKVKVTQLCLLFETLWPVDCQDPLSMELSRQEYWNGLPFPSPGDLPNPRIVPRSPAVQADSLPTEPSGKP